MREMGFTQKWPKLRKAVFTTFRFERKDRDWWDGEYVRVVYRPRHKDRLVYGTAEIIKKEITTLGQITDAWAVEDGFDSLAGMMAFMRKTYGPQSGDLEIHRLTLKSYYWMLAGRLTWLKVLSGSDVHFA